MVYRLWIIVLGWACLCAAPAAEPSRSGAIPIGLNGIPRPDSQDDWEIAEEFQLDFYVTTVPWEEPAPGAYAWPESPDADPLRKHLRSLDEKGYAIVLTNTTVHMDQKHIPEYLEGKAFDDPALLDRWEAFLTTLLKRYGPFIDALNIGNEVDSYFGGHREEWPSYVAFVKRARDVVESLYPELKLGVVIAGTEATPFWPDIDPYCDYYAFTYYTPSSVFSKSPTANVLDPNHTAYFGKALKQAIDIAGAKPILITEIGCATHESLESSPELQAEFIEALFTWLAGREEPILGMSWLSSIDWPYNGTKQALEGYLDEALLNHEPFLRYLTSLGLMYEDGTHKPGYATFKRSLDDYRRGALHEGIENRPPASAAKGALE